MNTTITPALTNLNLPAAYNIHAITTTGDGHNHPCDWCEDGAPITTNIYYRDPTGNAAMEYTCATTACILAATELRHPDYDITVEVSTVPVDPIAYAFALESSSSW